MENLTALLRAIKELIELFNPTKLGHTLLYFYFHLRKMLAISPEKKSFFIKRLEKHHRLIYPTRYLAKVVLSNGEEIYKPLDSMGRPDHKGVSHCQHCLHKGHAGILYLAAHQTVEDKYLCARCKIPTLVPTDGRDMPQTIKIKSPWDNNF